MTWILNNLFHAMDYVSTDINSLIVKYVVLYWTLFVGIGILLLFWDLLIYIIRNILFEIFYKLRITSNLRILRTTMEAYYILDKLTLKVSIGIIRTQFQDDNRFRVLESSGPLSILNILKSVILRMVKIDVVNIIIWTFIIQYFNPSVFYSIYQIVLSFDVEKLTDYMGTFKIPKISKDLLEIVTLLGSIFGVNLKKYISKEDINIDSKNLEKVLAQQKKIEKILLEIIYKAEANIDFYSNQLDYYCTSFCEIMTCTDKFYVYKGQFNVKNNNITDVDVNIDNLVEQYEILSSIVNELVDIVKNIDDECLSDIFQSLNEPCRYEFIKLGLHNPVSVHRLNFNFFDKESLKKFFTNWTQNKYLKNRFIEIREVWMGFEKKECIEKKLKESFSVNYPFSEYENDAIESLKKKLKEFEYFLKYNLAESVWYYIIAKQYCQKLSTRCKNSTMKNVAKLFIEKK